ncbi:MAG: carboxypeptidase regulatory-like domain-containing protein [Actinobacteria bacterium]|jgi:nitrous oxidase accessory protein NosD|nr:carboxypeptidase regulatory-like domain-containing protein [Actinomycetota bacterium]
MRLHHHGHRHVGTGAEASSRGGTQRRSPAIVALLVSSLLATGLPGTAFAAETTVTVDQDDPSWFFSSDHVSEAGDLTPTTGTGGIEIAPVALPGFGTSAFRLEVTANQKARAMTAVLDGRALSDLISVTYSTYKSGQTGYGPSVNVIIDPAGEDDYATLVWEANKAGHNVSDDTWQTWTTGSSTGWWSPSITTLGTPGQNNTPTTLAALQAHFGVGSTIIGFAINVGRHDAMTAYVDGVGITLGGDTTFFDFELAPPEHCPAGSIVVAPGTGLQAAVNAAADGATLCLESGTYSLGSSSLQIDAPITVVGAGEDETIIDASGISGYGIDWRADDVTFEQLTLVGPSANIGSAYGFKIAPSGHTPLTGATLRHVTVHGSGRTEVDLHNVTGATLEAVTVDNPVPSAGAGVAITNSTGVTIDGLVTGNNTWGGLALYTSANAGALGVQQVRDVTVSGAEFGNDGGFGFYLQDSASTCSNGGCAFSGISVSDSSFANPTAQIGQITAGATPTAVDLGLDLAAILADTTNTFVSHAVVTDAAGAIEVPTVFSTIGGAVTAATAGHHVRVGGSHAAPVSIGKAVTLVGETGATVAVGIGQTGITVAANDVTVRGLTVDGAQDVPHYENAWTQSSTGILVNGSRTGVVLDGNTVRDVRTGVYVHPNAAVHATDNTIENTKGSFILYSHLVTMEDNRTGSLGNEWDIVVLLESGDAAAYFGDPNVVGEATYGANVLALSEGNNAMTVLDRRFGSNGFISGYTSVGNRSHVIVDAGSTAGATEDFNLGNGLGNPRQPLGTVDAAIGAVVHGGRITVRDGTYTGNVAVDRPVDLAPVDQPTLVGEVAISVAGQDFGGFAVTNPAGRFAIRVQAPGVTVHDNHIHHVGTSATGTIQAVFVEAEAFDTDDVTIRDNVIETIGHAAATGSSQAVLVGGSTTANTVDGLRITGNTIRDVTGNSTAPFAAGGRGAYGVQINAGATSTGSTQGAVVANNVISDLTGYWVHAIGLEGPTPNAQVLNNSISDLTATKTTSNDTFDDEVGVFFQQNPGATSTVISQNSITGATYGVATHSTLTLTLPDGSIDARRNYWGPDGPTGVRLGTGDPATAAFAFSPWLSAPGGGEVFTSGVVSGRVTTAAGIGVAGVTVSVSGAGTPSATTDGSGNYSLSRAPGTYTATVTVPIGSISAGPTSRTVIVASGGSATADFMVVNTGTISGVVRNAIGVPVNGVTVALRVAGSTVDTALTGTDGQYSFTRDPGVFTVAATVPSGFAAGGPMERTINLVVGSSATADFVLAAAASISGRVVDTGGAPRAGVTVALSGAATGSSITDADGRYQFLNRTQFGVYTVAVTPPSGFVAGGPSSRSVNLVSGSSAVADFTLARDASIAGRVLDSTGAGVAGVTIAIGHTSGTPAVVTRTTDAQGRYALEGVGTFGAYAVTMTVPSGFSAGGPVSRAVNLASGSSATADFALVESASITGQVVDGVGAPLSGVTVTLAGAGSGSTQTDTSGRYRFANRTTFGAHTVTVTLPSGFVAGGAPTRSVNLAAGSSASADFRLLQQGTITGQVLDTTGAPVSGVEVNVGGISRTTDVQGRYSRTGVDPGAYAIVMTVPIGFTAGGATTRTVNLAGGSSATADFRLAATAAISGQVTDVVGAPLSGVTVTITAPGGGDTPRTTDAQGRYRLSGLDSFGTYRITVTVPVGFAAGGVTTRAVNLSTGSAASADFLLAQTASIVGQVRDATGTPVSGVTISLGGVGTGSTQTDATGSYRFVNRSQFGAYTVTMTVPGGFVANGPTARTVNLASGQSATASFALTETGTISGQVVDNTLTGVGGVAITLNTGETTSTDAEGRYRFPGLPTGGSRTVTVTVPDGFEADGDNVAVTGVGSTFDVILLPVGTVSGYLFVDLDGDGVRSEGEPPLAGLTVNLMVGGDVDATTVSAADGFYLFEGAPDGATVEVQAAGYSPTSDPIGGASFGGASFGGFSLFSAGDFFLASSHGTTAREDVGLLPAGTIVGSTRQSGGDPVAGVAVALSGAATGSSVSSADGVFIFTGLANNAPGADYTLTVTAPSGFTLSGAASRIVSLVSVSAAVEAFTLAATASPGSGEQPPVMPDQPDGIPIDLTPDRPALTTTPRDTSATWRDANGTTRLQLDLADARRRAGAPEPVFDAVRITGPESPAAAVAALGREGIRSAGMAGASEAIRLTVSGVDFAGGTICPTDVAPGQRIIVFDGKNLLGRDITTTVDGRTCGQLPAAAADLVLDLLVVDLDAPSFADVDQGSPHFLAVEALTADSRAILHGRPDGSFDAGGVLRRDQAAAILARALGLDLGGGDGGFPDVPEGATHAAAIAALMALDPPIISGFTDGTFRPGAFITRDQLASIVVRAYRDQLEDPSGEGFPDVPSGSVHADAIDRLISSGAISGFPDGSFGSGRDISRAQVASVIARSLYRLTGD